MDIDDQAAGVGNISYILKAFRGVEQNRIETRHLQQTRDSLEHRGIVVDNDDLVVQQSAGPMA